MVSLNEKQAAAEATLAEVKAEARAAEMAASDARVAVKGWPIQTPEGEVMVVEKIPAHRGPDAVRTEDGVEYERDSNQSLVWHKVGSTFTPTAPEAPVDPEPTAEVTE